MEKISILEQYRKIIVLMNMDIEFFWGPKHMARVFFLSCHSLSHTKGTIKGSIFSEGMTCFFKSPKKCAKSLILSTMHLKENAQDNDLVHFFWKFEKRTLLSEKKNYLYCFRPAHPTSEVLKHLLFFRSTLIITESELETYPSWYP